jgi:hypothetical protein
MAAHALFAFGCIFAVAAKLLKTVVFCSRKSLSSGFNKMSLTSWRGPDHVDFVNSAGASGRTPALNEPAQRAEALRLERGAR